VKFRFTKRAVRQIEEIIDAIALESPQGVSGGCWSALIPTSSFIALPRML
jgi:hypothetical protein